MDVTKTLREIIPIMETNKLWYRVFGGVAVDGYLKEVSRQHSDVDLLILEEEIEKIKEALKKYQVEVLEHKIFIMIEGVEVALARFAEGEEGYYFTILPTHKWPRKLLEPTEIVFEGIKFTAPSKEFLLSIKMPSSIEKKISKIEEILLISVPILTLLKNIDFLLKNGKK
ncbi:MAG: hypothetical protein KJI71_03300 [Patescibacteria group bacterium]|nr:hypothetical protein [Patescibacteria group bacterium]